MLFSSINALKLKCVSRATNCTLYKTVTVPVVTYSAETWVRNKSDIKTLMTF